MNENEFEKEQQGAKDEGSVWKGIGLGILLYVVAYILDMVAGIFVFSLIAFLLHIAGIVYFFVKGKKYTGIGLLILGGITILLIAACFGIVLYMFSGF